MNRLLIRLRLQASALYEAIEAAEGTDEAGLPDQAYTVPDGTQSQQPLKGSALFDAGANHTA